jgi:hypothetical protein
MQNSYCGKKTNGMWAIPNSSVLRASFEQCIRQFKEDYFKTRINFKGFDENPYSVNILVPIGWLIN